MYFFSFFRVIGASFFYLQFEFTDMLRSKNRGAPSNMKLFPEDVVRAESLTHGNPAILQNDMFLPEEKPAYSDLFASTKKTTPKRPKPEAKKKQSPLKPCATPRLITHPRFLQLSSGQSTDYEVRERKQVPVRAECDEEDTSPPTLYTCTECDYTTTRLNVMVWHNKSHTRNYANTSPSKATKRKSTASVKLKERPSEAGPSQPRVDDEGVSAAKIPKTNGTLEVTPAPRPRGRPKGSTKKTPAPSTPLTKDTKRAPTTPAPVQKRRRSSNKGDEIHKSLLEDWLEDDIEEPAADAAENAADGGADSKHKSCFDFDDSEDHLVIDQSKFKPGRKIPRLVNKSAPLTIAPDDVVAIDGDITPKYQSGVEDSADSESSPNISRTGQLQEMCVDNEIEIKTEEVPVDEVVIESLPPKKSRRNSKAAQASEAAELHNQVDKLLDEISKAPAKLPDMPRSHKKAQLKAYQMEAEAEKRAAIEAEAAQKATAEAEAAQKAAAEAEAEEKAIAEAPQKAIAETAQKAAAEIEAAQKAIAEAAPKAAAETEAAQKTATEAEAAHRAVAEVGTAQKIATGGEAAHKANTKAKGASKVVVESKTASKAETAQPAVTKARTGRRVRAQAGALPKKATKAKKAHTAEAQVAVKAEAPSTVATPNSSAQQTTLSVLTTPPNAPVIDHFPPNFSDDDVSTIPLPSPRQCPVTSEPVESSISIGASVTVADDGTVDEQSSPMPGSSETLVTKNVVAAASSSNVDQKPASEPISPQTPSSAVAADAKTPVKVAAACRILSPSDYRVFMDKLKASTGQTSPGKSSEPLKPIKTTIKMPSGKSILCDLSPSKMLVANSQSSGSPTKVLIVGLNKKLGATSTTTATAPTTTPVSRPFNLAHATTVRLSPGILPNSAAAQKVAAALAQSTDKKIVLDASTFHTLFQTQQIKVQSPVVPATTAESSAAVVAPSQSKMVFVNENSAPSSNGDCANPVVSSTSGQTVDYNFVVDSSGNLVPTAPSTPRTPTKDILAKALEDTDGLQTEMALSQAATNSVLDACSVAQNTQMVSKTDAVYENLQMSTAPIMSAYESPSRVAPNVLAEVASEVVLSDSPSYST